MELKRRGWVGRLVRGIPLESQSAGKRGVGAASGSCRGLLPEKNATDPPMNLFRWILAGGLVLAAAAWGALFILGSQFRRSFGASENNLLIAVVPMVIAVGLAWWLIRKS
jgi:hypothetical protein